MKLSSFQQLLSKFDWILLAAVLLLFSLGLAAIYSVSLSQEQPDFLFFKRQVLFAVVGLAIMFAVCTINYSAFRVYSRIFYVICLLLLVGVLFFGTTLRGTTGWFSIGGYGFQPVELAKIALIIFLAKFFANRFAQFNQAKHIIVSLAGTLILVALVAWQPDFGSAAVLLGCWFLLLLLTKVKARYIIVMILIACLLFALLWSVMLKDYQKERVLTFLEPSRDPLGSGYNVSQAMIAIGSGQIFGRGLGFGSQSQLKFIPESQSDFVFAVIAEELGFLGVSLIIVLWAVIFYRLIQIAKKTRDDFGMYLVLGILFIFLIHLLINIGMNLGLLPVTGLSLPFLSYGGSFLVVCFIMIGMAQSVKISR